jgi:hypothetical protein
VLLNSPLAVMASVASCKACGRAGISTSYCSACSSSFCDECWPKQIPYKPGKKTLDGRSHEKENKTMIERMHAILQPSHNPETLRLLHLEDQDNRWFSVVRLSAVGKSQFYDFSRYGKLMADSRPLSRATRYLKLISFVRDTNKTIPILWL